MKKISKISLSICAVALLFSGCSDNAQEKEKSEPTKEIKETKVEEQVSTDTNLKSIYGATTQTQELTTAPAGANVQSNTPHIVKVLETVDSGGYTYMKVDENGNIYWAAGPQASISVGSTVSYVEQMVMENFTSNSLNKTFDKLVFASTIIPVDKPNTDPSTVAKQETSSSADVTAVHSNVNTPVVATIQITKNPEGYTIEEVYSKKTELKDKNIKIDAQVVKVSKNIMGKDWIHLQDGSGTVGTNDIIATAVNSAVAVGDKVTMSGIVKTDVNLGYGYHFALIIEEANFTGIE